MRMLAEKDAITFDYRDLECPGWPAPAGVTFAEVFNMADLRQNRKRREEHGEPAFPVGFIKDREEFSRFIDIKDKLGDGALIKSPGSYEYEISKRFQQFVPAIRDIVAYDARYNPFHVFNGVALNVRQSVVEKGSTQTKIVNEKGEESLEKWHRDPTFHDGSLTASHTYVVTDKTPTFYQSRSLERAETVLSCPAFYKEEFARASKPYEINLMSCYCFHLAGTAEETHRRTFFRLIFSGLMVVDDRGHYKYMTRNEDFPPILTDAMKERSYVRGAFVF